MSTVRRIGLLVAANLTLAAILLCLLEGAASILFVAHEIAVTPAVPEHQHAEHDEELGWVNLPDVSLPDFYGPGIGVRTNGQRFRNDRDFPREVPPGKIRIVCSGDSFTFGYGVGDEDAWCEDLTRLDQRVETVNMGLGGYGVDQAYLWYRRDGVDLEHDIQLFVFLTDDFRRMRSDRFMGYGKPLLDLTGDSLVVANHPVPETSWLTRRRALHGETLGRLALVRLARRLLPLPDGASAGDLVGEDLRRVVVRIFADLDRINRAKESRLVLVYLPGAWDYQGEIDLDTEPWRQFVAAEAGRQGIPYIDLVEEIRNLPPTEVSRLFAPNAHFSVAGNEWAAETLYSRLWPLIDQIESP